MRPLQPRAPLLDEPGMKKVDAEQPQQRDLRIGHEDFDRRQFERLRGREPALDPCASRARSALKLIHLSMHDARGEHKHWIVRCRRERLGSFRHRQRLGIVRPQTKNEPEPVQQPSCASDVRGCRREASTHAGTRSSLRDPMPCTWVADTP